MRQQLTETGPHNLSSDAIAETTAAEIHGGNTSWNKANSIGMDQLQRRNSTGSTPRLLRHVTTSRATSPNNVTPSRATSPSRAFHVPSQPTSQAHHAPSPARFVPSRSVSPAPSRRLPSHASTPVRQLSSPSQFRATGGNTPAGLGSRRRSIPSGQVPSHATGLVAANVHNSPRRYRKLNGNVGPSRHVAAAGRARHLAAQKSVSYGGALSDGDGAGFLRTLDSIATHSGSRSAYDFVEANRRKKPKSNSRQAYDLDVDLDIEEETESSEPVDDKPWLPTGIYAVFLITLWTAVVRLIDSVEENGPGVCSAGEETRLWICAASFSLVQGLAEALWQRKNLLKVLFSMSSLFGYFIISHIQPLSCRIGEDKVTELSKWQSAMNFFVSALLGIKIYRHIQESRQERRSKKEGRKRKDKEELDEFEGLPEGVI